MLASSGISSSDSDHITTLPTSWASFIPCSPGISWLAYYLSILSITYRLTQVAPPNAGDIRYMGLHRFDPWVGMQPDPIFLFGESHGQRSPMGYGPQGRKELNTTEAT